MWALVSNDLPATSPDDYIGLPLSVLGSSDGSRDSVGLCQVEPNTTVAVIASSTSTTITVNLTNATAVFQVAVGNSFFTPAVDPASPQPGEFIWSNSSQTATLYTSGLNINPGHGIGAVVTGATLPSTAPIQGTGFPSSVSPALPIDTDYIEPGDFYCFYGLPVTGSISWSCSFEQQPSGSISLFVQQANISSVRSRFARNQLLQFAGIGFCVSSYSEHLLNTREYVGGFYEVNVSLTGWVNQRKYLKPVLLRTPNTPTSCSIGSGNTAVVTLPATSVTVSQLAARNGVGLSLGGNSANLWTVSVAANAPADTTANWLGELQARLRVNGCFIRFSSPGVIQARLINSVNGWNYYTPEFEIAYQAENKSVHYKVSGQFSAVPTVDNTEDNPQQNNINNSYPMWQKKPPLIQTVPNGDATYATCPDPGGILADTSSNYDTSGPTKSYETTKSQDGTPLEVTRITYGYAYSANDIYTEDESGNPIYKGDPTTFWKQIKQDYESFVYDVNTGYLLGSQRSGWQTVRFGTEPVGSDASTPPTVLGNSPDASDEEIAALDVYKFRTAPITGFSQYFLGQHSDYYVDIPPPPMVPYYFCAKTGTGWQLDFTNVIDPNYVPSMFVLQEQKFTNTYLSLKNPQNQFIEQDNVGLSTADRTPLLPDLTTGEETFQSRLVTILPSATTVIDSVVVGQDNQSPDRYLEYTRQFSASGPSFASLNEEDKTAIQTGRPKIADKLTTVYQRLQPDVKQPNTYTISQTTQLVSSATGPTYQYSILTSDRIITDANDGTQSYPYAVTTQDALVNARTDLTVQQIQETVSASLLIPFNPNIREFDRVTVATDHDTYTMRVLGFSNTVNIQGQLNGSPFLTSDGTKLTLGQDSTVNCQLFKQLVPTASLGANSSGITVTTNTKGLTLGWIDNIVLPSRRSSNVA